MPRDKNEQVRRPKQGKVVRDDDADQVETSGADDTKKHSSRAAYRRARARKIKERYGSLTNRKILINMKRREQMHDGLFIPRSSAGRKGKEQKLTALNKQDIWLRRAPFARLCKDKAASLGSQITGFTKGALDLLMLYQEAHMDQWMRDCYTYMFCTGTTSLTPRLAQGVLMARDGGVLTIPDST